MPKTKIASMAAMIAMSLSVGAEAQPRPAPHPASRPLACSLTDISITSAEKEISWLDASGTIDDSAPRAEMRAAQTTVLLQEIGLDFQILSKNGCPLPNHPIDPLTYMTGAVECYLAERAGDEAGTKAKCDRSHWPSTPVDEK